MKEEALTKLLVAFVNARPEPLTASTLDANKLLVNTDTGELFRVTVEARPKGKRER